MSEESYLDSLLKSMNDTEEFSLSDEEMDSMDVADVKDIDLVDIELDDIDISNIDFGDFEMDTSSDLEVDMPMMEEAETVDFTVPVLEEEPEDIDFAMPVLEDEIEKAKAPEAEEIVDVEIGMLMAGEDSAVEEEQDASILNMFEFEKDNDAAMNDVDDLLDILSDNDSTGNNSAAPEKADGFFSLDGLMDMEDDISFDDLDENTEEISLTEEAEEEPVFDELDGESLEDDLMGILNEQSKEEQQPKKNSIFTKLFANIHDAKSKRAHEKMLSDEERRALKKKEREEKKAAKKAMKEDPAYIAEQEAKKKEKEEKKAQARAIKEAKKREKAELKKQKQAEEEAEALKDQGRINRVGATIVFVCLGAFAASVIFGSNSFSYNQSVANAKEYFGNREYTEAYNEIRGVDLKGEDVETYDKIVTVMYVNKQLNSYNNYYAMQMYPEALDSLLKGLQKYDAHIEAGEQLGIINDLDYVRSQIIVELQKVFLINENEAYEIINSTTQEEYSRKVIETAQVE